jgi:hypothetical protein
MCPILSKLAVRVGHLDPGRFVGCLWHRLGTAFRRCHDGRTEWVTLHAGTVESVP